MTLTSTGAHNGHFPPLPRPLAPNSPHSHSSLNAPWPFLPAHAWHIRRPLALLILSLILFPFVVYTSSPSTLGPCLVTLSSHPRGPAACIVCVGRQVSAQISTCLRCSARRGRRSCRLDPVLCRRTPSRSSSRRANVCYASVPIRNYPMGFYFLGNPGAHPV